ncbi:uncharacterized protein N7487_000084 [Penicillium crustosum]|uniref:uncharacterized protein n=1 Tax=Penicillium crustosum TaxID=36656 RepID=UPI00238684AE|nr:uncharacterized protein N7487_000084 [Penicillium crustosum]KAJ5416534.1 hypothetical protein N7487_000084 [Penicillium crustosum]
MYSVGLVGGYGAQIPRHLSNNTHKKAWFDLGVDLHEPQQSRGLVWDPLWAGLRRLEAIIFSLSQLSSVIVLVFCFVVSMNF